MMIDYDDRPGIVRCGEHSDYGTITILFQVRTETCSKNKGSGGFGKLKLKPTHPGQSRWTRGEISHWRLALCGSDHWRDSYQRRRPAGESYFWEVSDNTSSSSSLGHGRPTAGMA